MKIYEYDPRKLPPAYLKAIGAVTAAFAQTESLAQALLAGCLGLDAEYGMAVTTHMTAPLRDGVLRAVAEIRFEVADLDELDDILDRFQVAVDKRNAIAHRGWCQDESTGQVFTIKTSARGSVQTSLIEMSVDQVESDAALIYEVGMDFMRFMVLRDLYPRLPPPRPRGHKSKAARKAARKKK